MNTTRAGRIAILAIVDWIILQAGTLLAALLGLRPGIQPFFYLLVIGMAAKLVGDILYFVAYPERRHWRYLDDYVLNDLLLQTRFVLPAAIAQGWLALQLPVFVPGLWFILRPLVVSPVVGVILWAVNRSLIEGAEAERYRPSGVRAARLAPTTTATQSPGEGSEGDDPRGGAPR